MRKAFSWNERFGVCDEHGNELYAIEGELLAMSKRLHVYDRQGDEAICIAHRPFAFPPGYELFVRGEPYGELAEGVATARALRLLADRYGVDMPICRAVYAVLYEGAEPQEQMNLLFTRSLKREF